MHRASFCDLWARMSRGARGGGGFRVSRGCPGTPLLGGVGGALGALGALGTRAPPPRPTPSAEGFPPRPRGAKVAF